ncbi:MAG: wax ester/triacylglycerol synthase family O-acyltransferase [Microlunatus sp.]
MPQRLTPLEVSLLVLDTAHAPAHVATVDIFEAQPDGLDYERLIALISDRIAYVPRYRQRVRDVPARLAAPIWVDDESFDLTFHVRRSALPRPGTMEQLREFVGRVVARRMDRSRPLWEMYVVEGLEGNRFAVVAKTHLTLVDGVDNVDIGQVLLDAQVDPGFEFETNEWRPVPEPGAAELIVGALWESAQDPLLAWQNLQGVATSALGVAVAAGEAMGGVGSTVVGLIENALLGSRPRSSSPLSGFVSEQRRVALVSIPLADLKAVRDEHNHTINDVILAVVTGALRSWLLTRGESIPTGRELTALVPMSVTEDDGEPTSLGSRVAPHVQPLPIGEPNALMRLHQVAFATQAHKETGRAVDARTLSDIAGFAPATLHALGVRVSNDVLRRQHDVLVTNVPGPQLTLFAAGERLVASYPVLPLEGGHLLAIGITSYDGQVFLGLTADRDAVSDLDVLAQCLDDAVDELLDTTVRSRSQRQPTRKASAAARKAAASKAAARQEARRTSGQRRAAMRNLASRAVELGTNATKAPAAKRAAASPSSTARKLPTTGAPAGAGETTGKTAASEKPAAATKSAAAKKATTAKKTAAKTTAKRTTTATSAKKAPAKKTEAS